MQSIPAGVKRQAEIGLRMIKNGFSGGTATGWNRARQLATQKTISSADLAVMRAWFARHGPDAANGGTSYNGYLKWIRDGSPMSFQSNSEAKMYRGAVAWLIWGGDDAYIWLKTPTIRKVLKTNFPNKKEASTKNNLTI